MLFKTIFPLLIVFVVLANTACEKDTSGGQQPMSATPSLTSTTIIQQVKNDMEAELSASDYSNLDWSNATIVQQSTKETFVTLKSLSKSTDSLVYLVSANFKVFQWGGRVQPVLK
jgi:hypothetical protein